MLLRANIGGMTILCLMGMVRSVEALIMLRLVQGIFSGTVVAAQAMVAAYTPARRSGVALGSLSAAVYLGSMAGTFVGGVFAEYFGNRYAFLTSGDLLLAAGLLVFIGGPFQSTSNCQVIGHLGSPFSGFSLAGPRIYGSLSCSLRHDLLYRRLGSALSNMAVKGDAARKTRYGFRLVGHSPFGGVVLGANHEWFGGLGIRYPRNLPCRSLSLCRVRAANISGNKNTVGK